MMHIVFWHWWVLAGLLLLVELAWPRYVLLWLAFAAAAVGFLLLVFPVCRAGLKGCCSRCSALLP